MQASRRGRLRLTVALLPGAWALACATSPAREAPPGPAPAQPPPAATEAVLVDAGAPGPTVDDLALLASSLAPGMREVDRGERSLPASIPLTPAKGDSCVRVVLGAPGAVVGALVTDTGRTLDLSRAGKTTTLGDKGPVCLMKDQAAHVEVQGPAGPVRYVVWVAP
jgi:hypothetical protein